MPILTPDLRDTLLPSTFAGKVFSKGESDIDTDLSAAHEATKAHGGVVSFHIGKVLGIAESCYSDDDLDRRLKAGNLGLSVCRTLLDAEARIAAHHKALAEKGPQTQTNVQVNVNLPPAQQADALEFLRQIQAVITEESESQVIENTAVIARPVREVREPGIVNAAELAERQAIEARHAGEIDEDAPPPDPQDFDDASDDAETSYE